MDSGARRVLVLALDGLDPNLFARFDNEGLLPHLRTLQREGAWGQLLPVFPPVSPVGWTSFLTGLWPAGHGVFDFVTKAPGEYHPTIGLYEVSFDPDGLPHYRNRRSAPTLFHLLPPGDDFCLWLPATFPAEAPPTRMLSGLGTPDLLATLGTSALYTTHPHHHPTSEPGYVHALKPSSAGWQGEVRGPGDIRLPLLLHRAPAGVYLRLNRDPARLILIGEWSPWLELRLPLARHSVRGLCRFKLLQATGELTLYRTPLWCHPADPLHPLAQPAELGASLTAEVGPFPTAGFGGDQLALREGLIGRMTYLEDAYAMWESQAAIARCFLDGQQGWRLGIIHLMTADALQHLFWRDFDSLHPAHDPHEGLCWGAEIERGYRWLDDLVGELRALTGPDTLLVILSDHGVVALNRRVDVNGWLHRQGYLVLQGDKVDWARSRAFSFGHGGIWLNLVGREKRGCVSSADYEAYRTELMAALRAWRDPQSGEPLLRTVWRWGKGTPDQGVGSTLPDIGFALNRGDGLERRNLLGRVGRGESLIRPNRGAWSGGHEGPYCPADVPGLLFLHGPGIPAGVQLPGARIIDLAPTLLRWLRVQPPSELDGRPLLHSSRP